MPPLPRPHRQARRPRPGSPSTSSVPQPSYEPAPDEAALDAKAQGSIKSGPGRLPAEVWICHNTAAHADGKPVYNHPTDNLLLTLPPVTCTGCGNVNPVGYVWRIIDCTVSKIELDLSIRSQGEFDTCEAHAILACMELMGRINGAVDYAAMSFHDLDMEDLFRKFLARFHVAFSYVEDLTWPERELRIRRILIIAQADGIGYQAPPFRLPGQAPSTRVLRMGNVFRVSARDVQHVVRLLAGGHPLVATIASGRTFRYEGAGQIYNGVTLNKNHSVLLIGSGVARWPGNPMDHNMAALDNWPMSPSGERGPRVFFKARGSYDDGHPVYAQVAMAVDFEIWADDLVDSVWGFHLA